METKELDNLGRTELFEMLKGKCKSRAKRYFYGILIIVALIIVLLLILLPKPNIHHIEDCLPFTFWTLICCLGIWAALSYYLFYKRVESIDSPERLLNDFNKTTRKDMILGIVAWIALIANELIIAFIKQDMSSWSSTLGIVFTGFIVFLMYKSGYNRPYRKDEEIREQLRELIENK